MRDMPQGDREHLLGRSHLEVEWSREFPFQAGDVCIGNVTPIFSEVCGDSVRPSLNGEMCCAQRVRVPATARIANGRDVVDVDPKALIRNIA
jgi:hypothetical protein